MKYHSLLALHTEKAKGSKLAWELDQRVFHPPPSVGLVSRLSSNPNQTVAGHLEHCRQPLGDV